MSKHYTTVDVLFIWSPSSTPKFASKTIKNILRSFHWFEYEKGNLLRSRAPCCPWLSSEQSKTSGRYSGAPGIRHCNLRYVQYFRTRLVLSTKAALQKWALFNHIITSYVSPHSSLPLTNTVHLFQYRYSVAEAQYWFLSDREDGDRPILHDLRSWQRERLVGSILIRHARYKFCRSSENSATNQKLVLRPYISGQQLSDLNLDL